MTMEGRMTVCNLSIEMGARGGMIAPDQKTFDYIAGRAQTPKGADWDKAMKYWDTFIQMRRRHLMLSLITKRQTLSQ